MLASEEPREGESSHTRFCSGGRVSDGAAHHNLDGVTVDTATPQTFSLQTVRMSKGCW